MTVTATAPDVLTVSAPPGAHFESEEVKVDRGERSLGEVPILVWDSVDAVRSTFGDEGVKDILDGTSLRVSYQAIARRGKVAGKTLNDIASAQVAFRPGKRVSGASTAVSRAASSAKRAAEAVNGDVIAALMEKIARKELTEEDLKSLVG